MNESYSYSYEDEKKGFPWKRLLFGIFSVILVIIIFLLFLRFCGRTSLSDDLLKAGKKYYENTPSLLPSDAGQCYTVSLSQLENAGLINSSKYKDCDKNNTYVKVCYLESKNYHYVAVLSCDSEKSNFGMWNDGTEKDLTPDKSDVRFKFIGQELNLGIKYYYPGDKKEASEVKEYYASVPDTNYSNKEDEQTGYKWYTEKNQNIYYNNGEYVSTQPSGYPNKGESKTVTNTSTTKPEEASYRKIETNTLYRYKKTSYQYKWVCSSTDPRITGQMISSTMCALRTDTFTVYDNKAYYTCNGTTDSPMNTTCHDFTEWSTNVCRTSSLNGVTCESKTGYTYTDTMWKWYKTGNVKAYYPSNSSNASGEKTYYIEAPISGAVKDESTKSLVHKYYKVEQTTDATGIEEWVNVTDGYVTEQELIDAFVAKGYTVNTLNDINKLDKIRYVLQLQYRNVEK